MYDANDFVWSVFKSKTKSHRVEESHGGRETVSCSTMAMLPATPMPPDRYPNLETPSQVSSTRMISSHRDRLSSRFQSLGYSGERLQVNRIAQRY
jgi:hypothetical protein